MKREVERGVEGRNNDVIYQRENHFSFFSPPPLKNKSAATSMLAPVRPKVRYPTMEARPKYWLEAQRQLQGYEPGFSEEIPQSLPIPFPSGPGHKGDLGDHLAKKQQQRSREGGTASSQAKLLSTIPKHKEGVGVPRRSPVF